MNATTKENKMATENRRVKVIKRLNPCNCGCRGRDPWHKAVYTRTVRNIRRTKGQALTTAMGPNNPVEFDLVGTARFPWGTEMVVRLRLYGHPMGWNIAETLVEDK
jgi:hypothetical protein